MFLASLPKRDGGHEYKEDRMTQSRESLVPRSYFSLETEPRAQRFEIWRDSISCIFTVEAEAELRRDSFDASIDAYMLGSLFLARTSSLQQHWHRSEREIARDGMDHYMLQVFEDGVMNKTSGEGAVQGATLVVMDLSRQVQSHTTTFTNLSLAIPRAQLEPLLVAPDDQHLRILSGTAPAVQILITHIQSLASVASGLQMSLAVNMEPHTLGLVAACLNAGAGHDLERASERDPRGAKMVARAVIEEKLSNPHLTPENVARLAGVSRSKLYALFADQGGVAAYIRDQRVRRVSTMLSRSDTRGLPISELARQAGFDNVTGFNRAFKARYDMSPRDMRALRAAGGLSQVATLDPAAQYGEWLHGL